jgi:uncharacterized protein with PQ loop repeat
MTLLKIITVVLSLTVTALGLTAQVRKNYLRKDLTGLSPFYFGVLAISYTFWVIYGFSLGDPVLIIPMTIGAIMSWVIVGQFAAYK